VITGGYGQRSYQNYALYILVSSWATKFLRFYFILILLTEFMSDFIFYSKHTLTKLTLTSKRACSVNLYFLCPKTTRICVRAVITTEIVFLFRVCVQTYYSLQYYRPIRLCVESQMKATYKQARPIIQLHLYSSYGMHVPVQICLYVDNVIRQSQYTNALLYKR
jgi:hypothetical protein